MQNKFLVSTLYKFVTINNCSEMQSKIKLFCISKNIKGTILLANEGINGTIAGKTQDVIGFHSFIKNIQYFKDIEHKESYADNPPFRRMKVRIKKEIVTIGDDNVNPNVNVGKYINYNEWNDIISDPEVINIDTRNKYEVDIGTFKKSVNPNTESFKEFKQYVKNNLNPKKHKKIAMFCTGGIRCEKASSFMINEGFEEVYHLKGGILKYIENIPQEQSLWEGDCFVFDDRVSVTHGLKQGNYTECHACRVPIKPEDVKRTEYVKGVSCHHCINNTDEDFKNRMRERQKQIELAKQRGQEHFSFEALQKNKQDKVNTRNKHNNKK